MNLYTQARLLRDRLLDHARTLPPCDERARVLAVSRKATQRVQRRYRLMMQ